MCTNIKNKWLVLVDNRCYATRISIENAFSIAHKLSAADQ